MRLARMTSCILVLGAGACAGAPQAEGALRARIETLVARGDTTALALLAERQCRDRTGPDRQTCFENYFVTLSDSGRVRLALGALSALAARVKGIDRDGHVYTHVIGIKAWKPGRDVAKVFESCNGLFQSGCYHGVIQAALTSEGSVDSARVAQLCDQVEGTTPNRWLRFQCVHGLGHGLEMIWNWDLPKALTGCDWLVSGWDRESCYGGAFMENAVASMPGGHHAPARVLAARDSSGAAKGDDEHAGHEDHAEPAAAGELAEHDLDPAAITFKMRDPDDPLYPCTLVGPRYWQACYLMQGGMLVTYYNQNFTLAAEGCDRAPLDVRHYCYLSMGTMASGITVQDGKRAARMCATGDPGYRPWCYVGVVKNFIDVTANPVDGIAFCRLLPPGRDKRQCYVAVGEQISILNASPEKRETACQAAPAEGREECRYGAQLLAAPPEGLPIVPGATG